MRARAVMYKYLLSTTRESTLRLFNHLKDLKEYFTSLQRGSDREEMFTIKGEW